MKKNIYVVLMTMLSVFILQACSSHAVKVNSVEKSAATTNEKLFLGSFALAQRLGEININEFVYSHDSAGDIEKEYKVVSEYTAASGNTCRLIRVLEKPSNPAMKDLVCRPSSGDWYWPPAIISE